MIFDELDYLKLIYTNEQIVKMWKEAYPKLDVSKIEKPIIK